MRKCLSSNILLLLGGQEEKKKKKIEDTFYYYYFFFPPLPISWRTFHSIGRGGNIDKRRRTYREEERRLYSLMLSVLASLANGKPRAQTQEKPGIYKRRTHPLSFGRSGLFFSRKEERRERERERKKNVTDIYNREMGSVLSQNGRRRCRLLRLLPGHIEERIVKTSKSKRRTK